MVSTGQLWSVRFSMGHGQHTAVVRLFFYLSVSVGRLVGGHTGLVFRRFHIFLFTKEGIVSRARVCCAIAITCMLYA